MVSILSNLYRRAFRYIAITTCSINMITYGTILGWPVPSLPKLLGNDSRIPTTSDEGSWVASAALPGLAIGSVLASFLLDRIGRKFVLLLTSIPIIVSWIMIAYAKTVAVLVGARVLSGICNGLLHCSMWVYLGEITDYKSRGLLGTTASGAIILGIIIVNSLGSYLSIRDTALILLTIPTFELFSFAWMPESPHYLLMKGKVEAARSSLRALKGMKDIENYFDRLTDTIEKRKGQSTKYLDLFKIRSNRKALFIVMGCFVFQQLSGILAIGFYSQIIFDDIGSSLSPAIASIIFFSVELVVLIIFSLIADRVGRRPLMVASTVGCAISLLLEGIYFYFKEHTDYDVSEISAIPATFLFVYIIMYALGLRTTGALLMSEIFPLNVKPFAISISDICLAVMIVFVSKLFQITKDSFGMYVPFLIFSGCCFIALFFTLFCIPETKGKTLEEIQSILKG